MADYCTLTDLQNYLGIANGSPDDVQLALAITTASAAIDNACYRNFSPAAATTASTTLNGSTAIGATTLVLTSASNFAIGQDILIDNPNTALGEIRHINNLVTTTVTLDLPLTLAHLTGVAIKTVLPRYFTREESPAQGMLPQVWNPPISSYPFYSTIWRPKVPRVFIDDLFDVSSVAIQDRQTGVPIALDRFWPYNAVSKGDPYWAIEFLSGAVLPPLGGQVTVAANFGWSSIPVTIKNACLLLATRYFKRKDSPFGVAGADAMGNAMRISTTDPDIDGMLASYRRRWAAV